jgi:hypothetical protein
MLRDPVDTMVSLYHYILRRPDHSFNRELVNCGVGFSEWLSSDSRDHLGNHQVRWLIGRIDKDPIGRDDIDRAKHIIAHECAAFGIVERFDESMLLFQDALGWESVCYRARNVYRQDGDRELADEAIGLLAESHALSFELCAFARELFEERVRTLGAGFAKRLERFRADNKAWSL